MKRRIDRAIILFDVTYADGSRSSRRKILKSIADGPGSEAAVKAEIEAQDREIEGSSGKVREAIKSIARSPV